MSPTSSRPISDYALIGDCHSAALVSREGSIDWLCWPRFDSGACFAALLGTPEHGHWSLAPKGDVRRIRRHYRDETLVLETEFETEDGVVAVIDFMPVRGANADVVRVVEGRSGRVPMHMEFVVRFDYGSIVPWVQRTERGIVAIAGPDMLSLRCDVPVRSESFTSTSDFVVSKGQRCSFDLVWSPWSAPPVPARELDELAALAETEEWWKAWAARCRYHGNLREEVLRSLITLKALTYAPTGGIVAAPTTSLPEQLGGERNWDYRYCWLRDATFTLYSLLLAGYTDEAQAWREWLVRVVAGKPSQMQIMYGLAGERRLDERILPWLPGYEGSTPVRTGNAACTQYQLDIFGEVLDSMHQCRRFDLQRYEDGWRIERAILDHLEGRWREPDEGIWEIRGPRRQFTHSKMMAWVAVDRAVRAVERFGREGPLERWRALRKTLHEDVCRQGYDAHLGAFVQAYGEKALDASLLMMPLVGFLPAHDPRVRGTVAAIERELMVDGFVLRYATRPDLDGLPPGEGAFLPCSFWLVDNLALQGRREEARQLFEHLLSVRNDVGLLSEEYDPRTKRLVGNFPQAFSHVSLIDSAHNLSEKAGPAKQRGEEDDPSE